DRPPLERLLLWLPGEPPVPRRATGCVPSMTAARAACRRATGARAHLAPRRRADAIERSRHDGCFGALDWRRIHQDAGAVERSPPVFRSSTAESRGGVVAGAAPRDFREGDKTGR